MECRNQGMGRRYPSRHGLQPRLIRKARYKCKLRKNDKKMDTSGRAKLNSCINTYSEELSWIPEICLTTSGWTTEGQTDEDLRVPTYSKSSLRLEPESLRPAGVGECYSCEVKIILFIFYALRIQFEKRFVSCIILLVRIHDVKLISNVCSRFTVSLILLL